MADKPSVPPRPPKLEHIASPDRRKLTFVALCVVVIAVVVLVVAMLVAHLDRPPTEQAKPPAAQPRPSLAGAPPEELASTLASGKDLPAGWKVAERNEVELTSLKADPGECLPRLLGPRGKTVGLIWAAAPDFTQSLYDGRYAAEAVTLPPPEDGGPLESIRSWLARCGSFTVQEPGRQDTFPAFAVQVPADIPGAEGSIGVKLLFAYNRTDPFQNTVYYFAIAQVRGVRVHVVSGLPTLPADLAEQSVAKLGAL